MISYEDDPNINVVNFGDTIIPRVEHSPLVFQGRKANDQTLFQLIDPQPDGVAKVTVCQFV